MGSSIDLSQPEFEKLPVAHRNFYSPSTIKLLLGYSPSSGTHSGSFSETLHGRIEVASQNKNLRIVQNQPEPREKAAVSEPPPARMFPHKSIFAIRGEQ